MVALVSTVAYLGLEARSVEVQCQIAPGLPRFNVVGLPDKAVNESRERVIAALAAMGLSFPPKRITINLSPADLPKEGSHYDLPIALALLAAMGVTDAEQLNDYVAVGELALDGRVISSPGVLLAAIHASAQDKGLICPAAQGSEARWASGVPVLAAPDLISLLNHLKGNQVLPTPEPGLADPPKRGPDLKMVKGQETAKRALEIAAAGGHNLLMIGPPGAGKSLLASCLPGILPELTPAEALEVSMVASVAGTLIEGRISRARPFRTPHHSASMAALTGGGLKVKPGEVSLAHLGVLFLDELPEFQRAVLDSLRQPLETGEVTVARANAHVTFPARVQLIAAMNPCRCGWLGDPALGCSRAPRCAADYQTKVSGPLLDRIDLHVEVESVSAADLTLPPPAEGSAEVAARVARAREVQTARLEGTEMRTNAQLDGEMLEQHATPDEPGRKLLAQAAEAMRLSARGYTRMLRVARTIADLGGAESVGRIHVAEALSGLRGVKLVISDAHEGIKAAVSKLLCSTWQRCRMHFMRNILAHAGKSGRRVVSAFIGTAFAQEAAEAASQQWRTVADQMRPKLPKLAALMDDAEPDVLAYMTFPKEHRVKLHSTNPIERLNGEIKRRTNVVGIFPNEAAITRLVGAILMKQNDEWAVQRTRYMTLETLAPVSDNPIIMLSAVPGT